MLLLKALALDPAWVPVGMILTTGAAVVGGVVPLPAGPVADAEGAGVTDGPDDSMPLETGVTLGANEGPPVEPVGIGSTLVLEEVPPLEGLPALEEKPVPKAAPELGKIPAFEEVPLLERMPVVEGLPVPGGVPELGKIPAPEEILPLLEVTALADAPVPEGIAEFGNTPAPDEIPVPKKELDTAGALPPVLERIGDPILF